MAISYTQTDTAMGCGKNQYCHANTPNTDVEGTKATNGGTAGTTPLTLTIDTSASDLPGFWSEVIVADSDTLGAGTATIRLNVTTGKMGAEWDSVYVCRLNSSCTNQETLGSSTGLAINLATSGVQSTSVTLSAASAHNAGDIVMVVYGFNETGGMSAAAIGITPDQNLDMPFTAGASDPQVSASDGVTVGESASVVVSDPQITASDGVTVGEVINLELAHNISVSDGLTVGEAVNLEQAYDLAVSDGLTVGEAVEMAGELYISEADGLTVGEAVQMAGELYVTEADGLTVGESVNLTVQDPGVSDIDISVSDGVTVGESVTVPPIEINASASDGLTVGESVTITPLVLGDVSVSDGITVGEAVEMAGEFYVSAADGLTVGEGITVDIPLGISVTDGLTVGETVTVSPLILGGIAVSDGLTIGEAATISVQILFLIDAAVTDAALYGVTLTDAALYGATLTDADLYNAAITENSRA